MSWERHTVRWERWGRAFLHTSPPRITNYQWMIATEPSPSLSPPATLTYEAKWPWRARRAWSRLKNAVQHSLEWNISSLKWNKINVFYLLWRKSVFCLWWQSIHNIKVATLSVQLGGIKYNHIVVQLLLLFIPELLHLPQLKLCTLKPGVRNFQPTGCMRPE